MDDVHQATERSDSALVELAHQIQTACLERGLTLATAESCTGGLLGHLLTEVAGSSGYFVGGVVSYRDQLKTDLLDVASRSLEHHGAVSAQVAVAMAEGARQRLGASIAISVTGIAGPGGGSAAKPVGLTSAAVADDHGHDVRRFTWTGDRTDNKRASARAALSLILDRLTSSSPTDPPQPDHHA